MGTIFVTDREGVEHKLDAEPGMTVMEITRDSGLPVEAICGGNCICTTCQIYVDPEWYAKLTPPSEDEQVLLEESGNAQPTSRLGCQVPYTDELDGFKATLAPLY